MPPFLDKILTMPFAALILTLASLGALLFVLVMQYGFGLHPCVLCLYQRVPFVVTAILGVAALVWKPYQRQTAVILSLCALGYLVGMGLAVFHTGVELHWWLGTSSCGVEPLYGASKDDLREALLHTVTARCDQIAWTVFGLSMANLNIVLSLGLAFFAAASSAKTWHDVKGQKKIPLRP